MPPVGVLKTRRDLVPNFGFFPASIVASRTAWVDDLVVVVITSARNGGYQMNKRWRCTMRLSFWFIAIVVSILPILRATRVGVFQGYDALVAINGSGLLRDVIFLAVAASVASTTELLYNLITKSHDLPDWIRATCGIFLAYFIYVMVYGTERFAELAVKNAPVSPTDLNYDLAFVGVCLLFTLFAQFTVVFGE